jgi:hypothetical protein
VAVACIKEFFQLVGPESWHGWLAEMPLTSSLSLALAPWAAYVAARRKRAAASDFDRIWLDFRDRFGVVWGQQVREQFNRSAVHAGWSVHLSWSGLVVAAAPGQDLEMVATLHALLKRFGPAV